MKLGACAATNFGSYKSFEFDFSKTELGLIYGPTGSGKSTIADIPCWILFGVTAKNGAVDEVKSWQANGEPTTGVQAVETANGTIFVHRVRGSQKQNDLFFVIEDKVYRGKDLNDTQKLLNERLGVTADLYLSSAYFSEFSTVGNFFMADGKTKRGILERTADLSLPMQLAEKSSEKRKEIKKEIEMSLRLYERAKGTVDSLQRSKEDTERRSYDWKKQNDVLRKQLQEKSMHFEEEKRKKLFDASVQVSRLCKERDQLQSEEDSILETIRRDTDFSDAIQKRNETVASLRNQKCPVCGSPKANPKAARLEEEVKELEKEWLNNRSKTASIAMIQKSIASIKRSIDAANANYASIKVSENQYTAQLETSSVNPFSAQLSQVNKELATAQVVENDLNSRVGALQKKLTALNKLYELCAVLRGALLEQAVKGIEVETNRILDVYFDADIRVSFMLDEDNLDVTIRKNGYTAAYTQLSKGQRSMLRLAFSVSVMQAASNKAGVHMDNLFFDEALDGLDNSLKSRAFGLFEELSTKHNSVLLIDHAPEFHNLFSSRYKVSLSEDCSEIDSE